MATIEHNSIDSIPLAARAPRGRRRRAAERSYALEALLARMPAPKPSLLARWALRLALFAIPVCAMALLIVRTGRIEWNAGLAALAGGLGIALLGILVGVTALAEIWHRGTYGAERAFAGVLIGIALLAAPAYYGLLAADLPAITDVTTDPADPPRFDGAVARRRPGENPTAYPGARFSALQAEAYPEIVPLKLDAAPDDVQIAALQLAAERGWRILDRGALPRGGGMTGRIELLDRTPVLGLADDIVVRIRPEGTGSRVDMRSASRIGTHDLGRNADRVRDFLRDLSARVASGPRS
jgi:hypothetical protein